jgi:hypothetical protein
MFPPEVLRYVQVLQRKYKGRRRYVRALYPIIEITIDEKLHRVCFQLFFMGDQFFEIQNPTYHYFSKISHYDFHSGEKRFSRNKDVLFTVISDLKLCGLWGMISNKDFVKVNEHNVNSDKKRLEKELGEIIGEEGSADYGEG